MFLFKIILNLERSDEKEWVMAGMSIHRGDSHTRNPAIIWDHLNYSYGPMVPELATEVRAPWLYRMCLGTEGMKGSLTAVLRQFAGASFQLQWRCWSTNLGERWTCRMVAGSLSSRRLDSSTTRHNISPVFTRFNNEFWNKFNICKVPIQCLE